MSTRREAFRKERALHVMVQPWGFVTDDTCITKDGPIFAAFACTGMDDLRLEHETKQQIGDRKRNAIRPLGPDFLLYEYLIKSPAAPLAPLVSSDPVVSAAHARRATFLNRQPSWRLDRYMVLLYTGLQRQAVTSTSLREKIAQLLNPSRVFTVVGAELDAALLTLEQAVADLMQPLDQFGVTRLRKAEMFQFLSRLLNYGAFTPEHPLFRDVRIDELLTDQTLEDRGGLLQIGTAKARVLTLMEPPAQSHAGFLRALEALPGSLVMCLTWRRIDNDIMRGILKARQRFFFGGIEDWRSRPSKKHTGRTKEAMRNADAEVLEEGHREAIRDMEGNGLVFGECSMTIVVSDANDAGLNALTAAARAVLTQQEGILHLEVYNAVGAFLATIPGNVDDNIRTVTLPDTLFADMSPTVFSRNPGPLVGSDGRPAVMTFETAHDTHFHLHTSIAVQPHTLVLGSTGAGKSFTAKVMALFSLAVFSRLFVIDIGGTWGGLCRALGGQYTEFNLDGSSVKINPFIGEPTSERLEFLVSWVLMLIRGPQDDHYLVTMETRNLVTKRIAGLMALPPHHRSLSTLRVSFPEELQGRLTMWVRGGTYGELFDHVEDTLHNATRQVFNMQSIFDDHKKSAIDPLFALLWYRERQWQAATMQPTLHVFEEVWLTTSDDTLKANLKADLKSGRANNIAVMLITQSLGDLTVADIREHVLENCATKILLPTTDFDRGQFAALLGLNQEELSLFGRMERGRDFLLKRSDLTRVCRLRVDADTLAMCESPTESRRAPEMRRREPVAV